MARRREDWNIDLAKRMRNAFARAFLLAAIDEGLTVQQVLAKVIQAVGITEFAARVGMPRPNVQRAIHPRHNPTRETLNRLLALFRLQLRLTPIAASRRSRAARGKYWPTTIRWCPGGVIHRVRNTLGSDRAGG